MSGKGKAPTGAATSAGAGVEPGQASRQAVNSENKFITAAAGRQMKVADYLGHDRETARTGRELCAALGMDHRTLRQRIERERRAGALIVADNISGYWLTDDPAEAQRFARSMGHRAREILRTAQAIERSAGLIRECEGQVVIE